MWKRTLVFTALILTATGLDLLSTYRASPDLSAEANPILAFLGGEHHAWLKLLAIKGVAAALAVLLFHQGLRGIGKRSIRLHAGIGLAEFYGRLFFRERVPFLRFLYGWPKDLGAAAGFVGTTVGITIAVGGLLGAAANTLELVDSEATLVILWVTIVSLSLVTSILVVRWLAEAYSPDAASPGGEARC